MQAMGIPGIQGMIRKTLGFTQNFVYLLQWSFECNKNLYQKGIGIRKMEVIAVCGVAKGGVSQVSLLKVRKVQVENKRIQRLCSFQLRKK